MSPPTSRDEQRAASARRILEAAQAEFGAHGLEGATIRGIARRAGVDPSLVLQHYASKGALFATATRLDTGAAEDDVSQHLLDVLQIRMDGLPPETRALMRSMLTAPEATAAMKAFLDERVANLARAAAGPDAKLRAAVAVSSILGLTIARHFLGLDALAELSEEDVEATIGPWLSAGLSG